MICIPKQRESAADLARQIAADPKERELLASIQCDRTPARPPKAKSLYVTTEAELMKALSDPEESLRGLLARVKLLEAQVTKLMKAEAARKGVS